MIDLLVYSAVEQIQCLQEAIYFEARSESMAGQIAVGNVVMNRVHDARWPNNVCDVVHQPWQFSYYYDGKPEVFKDMKAKQKAGVVAEMVFYSMTLDITENSLYYHSTKIIPNWDYSKIELVTTIDNHVFWKDSK